MRVRTRVGTERRVWSSGEAPTRRSMSSSTSSSMISATSSAETTPTSAPRSSTTGRARRSYFTKQCATCSWSSITPTFGSSVSIASSTGEWMLEVRRSRSETQPVGRPLSSITKTPSTSSAAGPSSVLIALIASPTRVPAGTAK